MEGRIIQIILSVLTALIASVLVTVSLACPCGPLPGLSLAGHESSAQIDDWSFANQVPLCQIEVDGGYPHSVNLNCMSSAGELFISCSNCEPKTWSRYAIENPKGRIRMMETVYPVTLRRLTDSAELDRAWQARILKLGREPDTPRPEGWWSFQLTSR
jgi:hypothetical protein